MATHSVEDFDRSFELCAAPSGDSYWTEAEINADHYEDKFVFSVVIIDGVFYYRPGYVGGRLIGYVVSKEYWNEDEVNDMWEAM
jgi:hypothetical protein